MPPTSSLSLSLVCGVDGRRRYDSCAFVVSINVVYRNPYLGGATMWLQPWRVFDVASILAGLSLFHKKVFAAMAAQEVVSKLDNRTVNQFLRHDSDAWFTSICCGEAISGDDSQVTADAVREYTISPEEGIEGCEVARFVVTCFRAQLRGDLKSRSESQGAVGSREVDFWEKILRGRHADGGPGDEDIEHASALFTILRRLKPKFLK
nr:hypothetical protein [Tanacetum cinerariifolium]